MLARLRSEQFALDQVIAAVQSSGGRLPLAMPSHSTASGANNGLVTVSALGLGTTNSRGGTRTRDPGIMSAVL